MPNTVNRSITVDGKDYVVPGPPDRPLNEFEARRAVAKQQDPHRVLRGALVGSMGENPDEAQRALGDIPSVALQGMNVATGGFTNLLSKRFLGQELPQAQTGLGKALQVGAEGVGFMAGGPEQIAAKGTGQLAERLLPKAIPGFVRKTVVGAAKGGASFGSTALGEPEAIPGRAAIGAAVGGGVPLAGEALGLIPKAYQGVKNIFRSPQVQEGIKLGERKALSIAERATAGQVGRAEQATARSADAAVLRLRRGPILGAMKRASDTYRGLIDKGFQQVGDDVVTKEEFRQALLKRFPESPDVANSLTEQVFTPSPSSLAGSPGMTDVAKFTEERSIAPARKIYDIIKSLSRQISTAARKGQRTYTPSELNIDHAYDALTELLVQRGGSGFREAQQFWAGWAPLRDKIVSTYKPFQSGGLDTGRGANIFLRAARGKASPEEARFLRQSQEVTGVKALPRITELAGREESARQVGAQAKQSIEDVYGKRLAKEVAAQERRKLVAAGAASAAGAGALGVFGSRLAHLLGREHQ